MIILNKLVNYQKDLDKQISENIIWPNHRNKLNNYDSLLTINQTEYKMKVLNFIKNKK